MSEICRKDALARNLNRMLKLFPKDYNIFPKTWILPAEYVFWSILLLHRHSFYWLFLIIYNFRFGCPDFINVCVSCGKEYTPVARKQSSYYFTSRYCWIVLPFTIFVLGIKVVITLLSFSWGDLQQYGRQRKNRTYILKPDTGCQGKGIWITKSTRDIKATENVICQTYIGRVSGNTQLTKSHNLKSYSTGCLVNMKWIFWVSILANLDLSIRKSVWMPVAFNHVYSQSDHSTGMAWF